MADSKISQLPEETQLSDTDVLPIVNNSTTTTSKVTRKNLLIKPATLTVAPSGTGGADYYTTGTADDVQIQAAINALPSSGGKVVLREGTYNLSAGLTISNPYVTIEGMGWSTILKLNSGVNAYIFTYTPGTSVRMDGVIIRNMKLDCNNTNQTATSGGIDAFGSAYNLFEKLWIEAPYTYGIYLHSDNLGGFGHHNVIRACWFHLGTTSPAHIGVGVQIHNADENIIENNIFESNGGTASSAAQLFEDASLQTIHNNVFIFDPNTASVEGIKCQGGNTISGNTFDGGTNHQIELGGDYNTVVNNRFYQPISTSAGIFVGGQKNTISANSFASSPTNNASYAAIKGDSASGTNLFTGNTIKTDGSWSSGAAITGVSSNIVRDNIGFATDAAGTIAVASGKTAGTVTHGLSFTPVLNNILVTPNNSLGSATKFWVSSPSSTQFIINTDQDPGATTAQFAWRVSN